MKVECPSCFANVVPMSGNRCPACLESLDTKEGGLLTKVIISQKHKPGERCIKCGIATREQVKVKKTARNNNFQSNGESSLDSHPLAVLINLFGGKYHQTVSVTIPLCTPCQRLGPIEPRYIDFENKSMTFVGHRALKEQLQQDAPHKASQ